MGPKDHIWDSTQLGQGNWTQRPYMGFNTAAWDRESGPKDHRIQHSWDRETRPKYHIWDSTQLGQGNRTQRPYMGFNTAGTGKVDPKTIEFNTAGTGKPDPKTIWDPKTIYGI